MATNLHNINSFEYGERSGADRNRIPDAMPGLRVPPHAAEAELFVLGGMMLDRSAISRVLEVFGKKDDVFYSEVHNKIYRTMISLFDKNVPVDIITLGEELKRLGELEFAGGLSYLADINRQVPTSANIEHHALIVFEKYLKRNLIEVSGKVMESAYDPTTDAFEEIDRAETEIFKIAEQRFSKGMKSMKELSHQTFQLIEKMRAADKDSIAGVPTGIIELDKKLSGGFQNSDLVIIAARPSMGKTALALSFARNAALSYKKSVAFFSIEMAATQLVTRLAAAEAKIDQSKLRIGNINHQEAESVVKAMGKLSDANIYIDDSPNISITELRAKCRRLKAENKLDIVMVDYLQLVTAPKADTREREISLISQALKQMAKEFEIPVVALAQLNRSVETRPGKDKRPMLSDLRESGSIEQDADVVIFVNRPEVYHQMTYEDGVPTEGTAELIIGKQRNGPVDTVRAAFIRNYARFENLEVYHSEAPPNVAYNMQGYIGDSGVPLPDDVF